ncbi:hypothetical protein GCM10028786_31450 [Flaviaesturariibacter terrae]
MRGIEAVGNTKAPAGHRARNRSYLPGRGVRVLPETRVVLHNELNVREVGKIQIQAFLWGNGAFLALSRKEA